MFKFPKDIEPNMNTCKIQVWVNRAISILDNPKNLKKTSKSF